MAGSFKAFAALYLATLFLLSSVGLLSTYLSLQLTVLGTSAHITGLVLSSYFLGMFIGALQCHKLIRSVGHIRAFAAYAALATAVVMLHGIHTSPIFWGILRFLSGISTIGLYMVIESWLSECSQPHERGKTLAIYMVMSYLGMAIGQQLLSFGNVYNLQLLYIVGLFLVLCLVPVATTHSIHPQLPVFEGFNVLALFRKAPTGMLGCFSAGLLNSGFYAMGPVFCHQIGMNVTELSLVMTVTILGGMLLQWPMGLASDRFDRTYVLAFIGFMITNLSILILFAAGRSYTLFLCLMALYGGLIFTLYPVSVARAHDLFETKDIIPVSSVLLLSYGTGATIGPILASTTMSSMDTAYGLFAYSSIVAAVYGLVTFILRNRKIIIIVPPEENTAYVAMQNTSPMVAEINPHSEVMDGNVAETMANN